MKSTDDHSIFTTLIGSSASSGDIATIPATQGTAGDGTASLALAFPPETFIAQAAGGKPPRGADMNGFLRLLSHAVQALQAGYVGQYNADLAQSIGGYPSGAIVSGSAVGTFWISTADNNVTVPGGTGATWKSLFDGYATQDWANSWFVKNAGGTEGIISATIDSSTGQPTFQDGSGNWHPVQAYGSYATTIQLDSEITRATTAEENLQTTVGQKVSKSGDTMNGALVVEAYGGVTASWSPTNPSAEDYVNYPALTSSSGGRGGSAFIQLQEHVGITFTALFGVTSGSNSRYFELPIGSRANDSAYGDLAYVSDLSNYQPAGNYALVNQLPTAGSVTNGFRTIVDGVMTQQFTATVSTGQRVSFPVSFSGTPAAPVMTLAQNSHQDHSLYNWDSGGFTIWIDNGSQNMVFSFVVMGPV